MTEEHYPNGLAVEQAIKAAAKHEHQMNPDRDVNDIIRQMHYDRFLCRIFSEGEQSEWVLKGGSAMLARIPTTRRTLDADLFQEGYDLEQSLKDLKRLASVDLHDFFSFTFESAKPIAQGDNQPYLDGYRVSFAARIGTKQLSSLHIDLVTHTGALHEVEVMEPNNRIPLSKELETYPYRLYPITNQIADKVCAIVERVNGRDSTRIKDLVDLTTVIITQDCDADSLQKALHNECRKRRLPFPLDFHIPSSWKNTQFKRTATNAPAASYNLEEAERLATQFLSILDDGSRTAQRWDHHNLKWTRR